jgi:apolipoprotein N-acyltransferase
MAEDVKLMNCELKKFSKRLDLMKIVFLKTPFSQKTNFSVFFFKAFQRYIIPVCYEIILKTFSELSHRG